LDYAAAAPFASSQSLADALLTPTRIYVKSLLPPVRDGLVKVLAHITGGGLLENIPRVLPAGLGVELDAAAWTLPPVFRWLALAGGVAPAELARTFNCGIGMVAVVAPGCVAALVERLCEAGEIVKIIGHVVQVPAGGPRVVINGMESAWRG
ncbi:MAG: AIR synthase-related protein, partial [Rhodospirillaceae bacterium]